MRNCRFHRLPHPSEPHRFFSLIRAFRALLAACAMTLLFVACDARASASTQQAQRPAPSTPSTWKAARPPCLSRLPAASLLVDTGWPGNNGRDAERIQAAMKDAGITKIDKVLITHFHIDHVGGVPNLVERVKVGEFLDHGENREDSDITRHDYAAYIKAIGSNAAPHCASRRHHRHSRPQHRRAHRGRRTHQVGSRHQAGAQSLLRQRAQVGTRYD